MGSLVRVLLGIPLAIIATVVIFLGMYSLIADNGKVELKEANVVNINLARKIQDTPDQNRDTALERPQLDQPPPPPPAISKADFEPAVDGVSAQAPKFDTKIELGSGFNPDRDAQPLVRIPPRYPDRCVDRHKKTEIVAIEFDVTPQGQVINVRIVSSTNPCFDRASIRAAERWKYQPKVVDGKPQPRLGVRTNFKYQPPVE